MDIERLKDCLKKFKVTGSKSYFEEIYNYYLPKIYRFFVFQLFDSHLAQDLSSEVFLKVYKYFPGLNLDTGKFEAWIYKIAKNQLIDHYRKNKKRDKDISLDAMFEKNQENFNEAPAVLNEKFIKKEPGFNEIEIGYAKKNMPDISAVFSNKELISAFGKLPDLYKQVLVMKFAEDMDSKTIGRIINKTETSIRALKFRAITKLRENMLKNNGGKI